MGSLLGKGYSYTIQHHPRSFSILLLLLLTLLVCCISGLFLLFYPRLFPDGSEWVMSPVAKSEIDVSTGSTASIPTPPSGLKFHALAFLSPLLRGIRPFLRGLLLSNAPYDDPVEPNIELSLFFDDYERTRKMVQRYPERERYFYFAGTLREYIVERREALAPHLEEHLQRYTVKNSNETVVKFKAIDTPNETRLVLLETLEQISVYFNSIKDYLNATHSPMGKEMTSEELAKKRADWVEYVLHYMESQRTPGRVFPIQYPALRPAEDAAPSFPPHYRYSAEDGETEEQSNKKKDYTSADRSGNYFSLLYFNHLHTPSVSSPSPLLNVRTAAVLAPQVEERERERLFQHRYQWFLPKERRTSKKKTFSYRPHEMFGLLSLRYRAVRCTVENSNDTKLSRCRMELSPHVLSIFHYKPYCPLQRLQACTELYERLLHGNSPGGNKNKATNHQGDEFHLYWRAIWTEWYSTLPSSKKEYSLTDDSLTGASPVIATIPLSYFTRHIQPHLSSIESRLELEPGRLSHYVKEGETDDTEHPYALERFNSIFISIASYRDEECRRTVLDILLKAKYRSRLVIGIAEQHYSPVEMETELKRKFFSGMEFDEEAQSGRRPRYYRKYDFEWSDNTLDSSCIPWQARVPLPCTYEGYDHTAVRDHPLPSDHRLCTFSDQIRVRRVSPRLSSGPTFGRYLSVVLLYQGESYLLKVDSHSRFIPYFDSALGILFSKYNFSRKTVLSHYPLQYEPRTEKNDKDSNHNNNSESFYQFNKTTYLCQSAYIENYSYPRFSGIVVNYEQPHTSNTFYRNLRFTEGLSPISLVTLEKSSSHFEGKENNPFFFLFRHYKEHYLPQPFLAGGFSFSHALTHLSIVNNYYDPFLWFLFDGEEILNSIKLFTHSFFFYSPSLNVVYHYYIRKEAKKVYPQHAFGLDRTSQPRLVDPVRLPYYLQTYARRRVQYLFQSRVWAKEEGNKTSSLLIDPHSIEILLRQHSIPLNRSRESRSEVFYLSYSQIQEQGRNTPNSALPSEAISLLSLLPTLLLDMERYGLGRSQRLSTYYRMAGYYYDEEGRIVLTAPYCGWWDSAASLKEMGKDSESNTTTSTP